LVYWMEHIEDEDSLDDDALNRLGVEGFPEEVPDQQAWASTVTIGDMEGLTTIVDGSAGNISVTPLNLREPWMGMVGGDEIGLTVQGDMDIVGDIVVTGNINNEAIASMQDVIVDMGNRIMNLETDKILLQGEVAVLQGEIGMERCNLWTLEDRVKMLEELLESSVLTPKRD
jgi:hypothetical protein